MILFLIRLSILKPIPLTMWDITIRVSQKKNMLLIHCLLIDTLDTADKLLCLLLSAMYTRVKINSGCG